ncbi:MAG: hypothetical protein ACHQUB_00105 [Candidatus Saccharimonadia bacterium]
MTTIYKSKPLTRAVSVSSRFGREHGELLDRVDNAYLRARPGYQISLNFVNIPDEDELVMSEAIVYDEDGLEHARVSYVSNDPFLAEQGVLIKLLEQAGDDTDS